MKTKLITAFYFLCLINVIVSQENKTTSESLHIKLPSNVLIKGTSTLHNWESVVEKTEATLIINNLNDIGIETLNVKVAVFSIKSGKKTMDKLTYKALKGKEHPMITFIFKKGEIVDENIIVTPCPILRQCPRFTIKEIHRKIGCNLTKISCAPSAIKGLLCQSQLLAIGGCYLFDGFRHFFFLIPIACNQ